MLHVGTRLTHDPRYPLPLVRHLFTLSLFLYFLWGCVKLTLWVILVIYYSIITRLCFYILLVQNVLQQETRQKHCHHDMIEITCMILFVRIWCQNTYLFLYFIGAECTAAGDTTETLPPRYVRNHMHDSIRMYLVPTYLFRYIYSVQVYCSRRHTETLPPSTHKYLVPRYHYRYIYSVQVYCSRRHTETLPPRYDRNPLYFFYS